MNRKNGSRNLIGLVMACVGATYTSVASAAPRERVVKIGSLPSPLIKGGLRGVLRSPKNLPRPLLVKEGGPKIDLLVGNGTKDVGSPRLEAKATYDMPTPVADRGRLVPANTPMAIRRVGAGGSVSAAAVTVYRNDLVDPPTIFYPPGARCASGTAVNLICTSDLDCPGSFCQGDRMADDFQLASGACSVTSYSFNVVALPPPLPASQANPPFNVHAELWDGDPCVVGSARITGTTMDFTGVTPNQIVPLTATLPSPVAVPDKVWLALTFSSDNAGWIQAGEAEVGFTGDFWSEDNKDAAPSVACQLLKFGGTQPTPFAGFWGSVDCEIQADPTGACCDGQTCSVVTQAACTTGVWQGAFSKCDPSPCLTGACCSGFDFRTCSETTEAACFGDQQLFSPGETCNPSPCQPGFKVYENSFETGIFGTVSANTIWADQLVLGPGTPCDLLAYEVIMVADPGAPPYTAALTLWTDDDLGTPTDPTDDQPLAAVLATRTTFNNVPGDLTREALIAGPFTGVTLTNKVWVAIQTDSDMAGPLLGGDATVGFSEDRFAVFNDVNTPGVWSNSFGFGGFDPTGCPGALTCIPAGNFRVNLWCRGETPRGACCNPAAGTCVDNVLQAQCDGRWSQDKLCGDPTAFDTPCDQSACCSPFGCFDTDPATCAGSGGSLIPGAFCADNVCTQPACFGAVDDCSTQHGTPGCDNLVCCQSVCAVDSNCCAAGIGWDQACADRAAALCVLPPKNDHCADAESISGEGTFPFENATATTDGPTQPGCQTQPESDEIANDVWFCWTAPCSDAVHVQTCGLTDVDSKLAVYPGCGTCPPATGDALACNDDFCGFDQQGTQSQVSFTAVAGQSYSIRVGTFPGGGNASEAPGGTGSIRITCGTPSNAACAPGAGDCCGDTMSPGCADTNCCNQVCLCDPFCCEVEWDANCAGQGAGSSGCGAAVLCTQACGNICTPGTVTFLDPVSGVVDARQPYPPDNPILRQGFDRLVVGAPVGADRAFCWELCETSVDGTPNGIRNVFDNGDGTLTLELERTISTNAVTTITYVDNVGGRQRETFTSHSGNVNGNVTADSADVATLANCLTGGLGCKPTSCDLDHSGICTPNDLLRAIDLLTGADGYNANDGTSLPTAGSACP